MSVERDALAFFETLYRGRPEPSVIALSFKRAGGGLDSLYPLTPDEAASMAVGAVDCYHRVTPLAQRPPKGRGVAEDAIALPGAWADLDVDGSPDGKGGVVTAAFESVQQAAELAGAVLEPSMTVCSGYGVQAYWLLHEPLLIGTDVDLLRAAAVGERLQRRLRQEAHERYGVQKLDSTADLARILRPVGSMNGKGPEPRPVVLLDDGDRRYTLDELEAVGVDVETESPTGDTEHDGPARSVEELLAAFAKLARIVRRDGNAPGKGSESEWDWWLACESRRSGLNLAEFASLLRCSRPDQKAQRADYVEGTWRKAGESVKADEVDHAGYVSRRWRMDDPIDPERHETIGDVASGEAIVKLYTVGGRCLRIPRLGDLFSAAKHNAIVSQVTRSRFPPVGLNEAVDLTQRIIALCGGEDLDPLDEAGEYVTEFIAHIGGWIDALALRPDGQAKTTWDVLAELQSVEKQLANARDHAGRTAIVVQRDELYLPAGALKDYSGSRLSWPRFRTQLKEIEWRHEPRWGRPPADVAGKPIHRKFFIGLDPRAKD